MKKILMAICLSALSVAVLPAGVANALTTTWTAGTSNWDNTLNWTNDEPTSGDIAIINNGGTASIGGLFDFEYADRLFLGYDPGNSGHVSMSSAWLTVSSYEYIGYEGTGTFSQSGGTHSVGADLLIGHLAESSGTYNLTGGALNINGNISSWAGTGNLNIDGGTLTVTGGSIGVDNFIVGNVNGASGSYTLASGESISASNNIQIGRFGTGVFTQTGGTNSADNYLFIGSGSDGTYNMSGGTLTASIENIGLLGTGEFNQTGGTHSVTNDLTLGENTGGTGTYNLNGGALNVDGNIVDGDGTGSLHIDGGALAVSGGSIGVDNFRVGYANGSNGSHTLASGESLSTAYETIGRYGTGVFTQTGGQWLYRQRYIRIELRHSFGRLLRIHRQWRHGRIYPDRRNQYSYKRPLHRLPLRHRHI